MVSFRRNKAKLLAVFLTAAIAGSSVAMANHHQNPPSAPPPAHKPAHNTPHPANKPHSANKPHPANKPAVGIPVKLHKHATGHPQHKDNKHIHKAHDDKEKKHDSKEKKKTTTHHDHHDDHEDHDGDDDDDDEEDDKKHAHKHTNSHHHQQHHKDEKKKDAKKAPAAPAAPAAAHVAHPAPTKTKSAVKTPAPSHGPPVNPLKRVMAGWNVNVVGGVHRPPPKFRTHKPTATDPKKAKPAPVNVHFIPGFLRPLSNPIVVQRNVPTKKSTGALVPVLVGIAVAIFVMCLCLQCLVHKKVVEESDGVLSGHSSAGVSHYYNNSNSATAARAAGANGANFGPEMSESVGGASSVAARGLGDGVTRRHSNHPAPVSSSMAMSSTSAVTSGNSASNSQGRYSAIANPVSLPEQFEDDREREMHERALAFERAHPFGSVATSITDEQAAHIADYGVAAWEMAVDPTQSSLVSVAERTEITFRNIDADSDPVTVQSNLPIPRNNPVYYFEVKLSSLPRGTTVSVGVSTKPYPLWRMCGWNKHSIGFFTDNGHVYQDNPFKAMPVGERCFEGDILGVGFQPHLGTLFFTRNGRRFRTVITGVHYDLFPTVSVVGGPARVEVNVGQVGFVFIEANVKKWRFAELEGTLSPPPAYGNDRGSILLQIGSSNGQGSIRNENDGAVGSSAESFVSSNSRNVDETTALDPAYADALAIASANSRPRSEAYDALGELDGVLPSNERTARDGDGSSGTSNEQAPPSYSTPLLG